MPDLTPSAMAADPASICKLAGENFEQRGFSAAVVADQSDAFAAVDGEMSRSNRTRRPKVFSILLSVARSGRIHSHQRHAPSLHVSTDGHAP
jgi:hypothetical protein